MGVTYTAALERDHLRAGASVRRFEASHALFLATSAVCLLAIAMAYLGRVRTMPPSDAGSAPILLVPGQRAETLEPAFADVFSSSRDRRLASREVARFLDARLESGQPLENVAALLTIRVPAKDAERPGLVPLLTPADLAKLKPRVAVRTAGEFQSTVIRWLLAYFAGFYGLLLLWHVRAFEGDRVLLAAAHILTALGFALLMSRADPLRDTVLISRFTQGVLVGLGLAGVVSWVTAVTPSFTRFVYLPLLAAIGLSALLLLFGGGPGTSGAKVNLGPVQPIEAIRLLLALFLASFFARRWELLRQTSATRFRSRRLPSWIELPRLDYVVPVAAGVATALLMFFLQKDLGPALFLSCVFLALYAVSRGRWPMALVGVATLVGQLLSGLPVGSVAHTGRTRRDVAFAVEQRGNRWAIRCRSRCGHSRPAACSAPDWDWGTRGSYRPATPT